MRLDSLHRVREQLLQRHVGGAIVEMRSFLAVYQHDDIAVGLDAVVADYELMSGYWQQGYRDPQLAENYERLLHSLYNLYVSAERAESFRLSAYLSGLRNRIYFYKSQRDWSPAFLRGELEAFVSEVAMADLEPPHIAKERRAFLYADHQHRMNDLFDFVWTSDVWTDQTAEAFEQMLLTPTIDSMDQQLLLAAIMLSTLNAFDMAKLRLLAHVSRQSQDEYQKQAACPVNKKFFKPGEILNTATDKHLCAKPYFHSIGNVRQKARVSLITLLQKRIYCMHVRIKMRGCNHLIYPCCLCKLELLYRCDD